LADSPGMRTFLLVAVAVSLLAGCLNAGELKSASLMPPDLTKIEVPAGGVLEALENGARLSFKDVKLPFVTNVTLPPGATLVRATGHVAKDAGLTVTMANAETGRRRCNPPHVTSWNTPRTGDFSCIGMTAVDPPGAKWKISVLPGTVAAATPLDEPATQIASLVTIDLVAAPLEGPAAQLDLSKLSMATMKTTKTQDLTITSFDGTKLHAQLTRPETTEKVPTIIISSPYHVLGTIYEKDMVNDWAPRGYAILTADVRGFARSGGCVEVWSVNEQKDQKELVDWAAKQDWSDGNVGFYGQSYVGTTPTEAAVQAPDALKAIIIVAPVIDTYYDWHFGGVPNGEDMLSPVSYQLLTAETGSLSPNDPIASAQQIPSGICDPTLTARANDPRAVYDDFYKERNFSARVKDVKAAVLYTHGYEDVNVKDVVGTYFFNGLTSPHLGLFGHWIHQHPPRADQETLFLAWMDQYVKGKPMGFEKVKSAQVLGNDGTVRALDDWPTATATPTRVLDIKGTLGLDSAGASAQLPLAAPVPTLLHQEKKIDSPLELVGPASIALKATLQGAENGYLAAYLYDKGPDGSVLVTFGMANLAHRHGHDKYEPVMPGEVVTMDMPFLTTDHTFAAGHTLVLEVRGARVTDWELVKPGEAAIVTLDGSQLVLPTLPHESAESVGPMLDWR